MNARATAGASKSSPLSTQAEALANWTALPDMTEAGNLTAQSFLDLSRWSMQEAERLMEQQLAFGRSMFDSWLYNCRELSDSGRSLCSLNHAAERLAARMPQNGHAPSKLDRNAVASGRPAAAPPATLQD